MTLPRRHHYVWRHYLEAWEVDGLLQASRNGGPVFSSSAANVALQRDFYRLPKLETRDVEFIREVIERMALTPEGKKAAYGWLKPREVIARIEDVFAGFPMPAEVQTALDAFGIQTEEGFHSGLETKAVPLLDALRRGECDFWSEDGDDARIFCFFIAVQHVRTKRAAEKLKAGIESLEGEGITERSWPYLKFVFASNLGLSIYLERQNWQLNIVSAEDGANFIVADQPIMNLMKPVGHYGMALYYPLSPRRALLIEHITNPRIAPASGVMDKEKVDGLNLLMARYSHELVFAANREPLDWCNMQRARVPGAGRST
jgi:hypothetical protein